jgi:hypothetical protein
LIDLLQLRGILLEETFRSPLLPRFISADEELHTMRGIENAVMVGYPAALWDHTNNLPLIRRGITATHPAIDFQGRPDGIVDLACFAGSSGSPVFLMDEGLVPDGFDTQGVANWRTGSRFRFLGVLYGQYSLDSNNEIKLRSIPVSKRQSKRSGLSVHLGCYHKAKAMLALGEEVKRLSAYSAKSSESA